MAERRRWKKKKEVTSDLKDEKPDKVEYAIAKYLRQELPVKKTSLLSHKVEYFIASKAVDCLLDSPWSTGKDKTEILFTTRDSVADYMDMMLRHKFFHRARKIFIQKEGKKKKKEKDEVGTGEDNKEKEAKREKDSEKDQDKERDSKSEKEVEEKKKGEEREKKRKKIKLDMHLEQVFVDGNEAYVWIYDPIPLKVWIAGTLLVLGAIALCLFPLWPRVVRHYIYYLSIVAAGFLVVIIGLAVIRMVVFVIIWLLTFGKHHLWLLPNLTEDVGFFESFWPLYQYEYKGEKQKQDDLKSVDKTEDNEQATKESLDVDRKEESVQEKGSSPPENQENRESDEHSENDNGEVYNCSNLNGDNGFEIVDPKTDLIDEDSVKNEES
ncbi:translocation protein SEC62-like [Limulus polyphemus]|uniref:Translocation protein SEC62 n=1 Tax=Limulus polyphemus TaxID=6850 RepID=A0ABM1BYB1_LIMPO|nr:translocation protein SEC62-like [Limulus polyphemus]